MKYGIYAVLPVSVDLNKKITPEQLKKSFLEADRYYLFKKDKLNLARELAQLDVPEDSNQQFAVYEIRLPKDAIGPEGEKEFTLKDGTKVCSCQFNSLDQVELISASLEHAGGQKIPLSKKKKKHSDSSESTSSENSSDSSSQSNNKKNQSNWLGQYFTKTTATILGTAMASTLFYALGGVAAVVPTLVGAGFALTATSAAVQFGVSLAAGVLAAAVGHIANAIYQYFGGVKRTEKEGYQAEIKQKKAEIREVCDEIKHGNKFRKELEDILGIKDAIKVKFKHGERKKHQSKGNELSKLLDYERKYIMKLANLEGKELKNKKVKILDKAEEAMTKEENAKKKKKKFAA